MPDVALIAVGINNWDRYTKPFVDTLYQHEPEARCIFVDNASAFPYNFAEYPNVKTARVVKTLGYAEALNYGAMIAEDADWYFFLNNDITWEKPFLHRFDGLDANKLHGFIQYKFAQYDYLAGWGFIVSRKMWKKVGQFDGSLTPMWFEDADYCIRAKKLGHILQVHDRKEWGIHHIEEENHQDRIRYLNANKPARIFNRAYVMRKHGLA